MQVFDIYTYNLNQIKFKDNKDYFDCLMNELGLEYRDIGFCFRSDSDGSICDKVIKQFKNLSQYKKYFKRSELYFKSMPEYQMSSVSVDDKGIINLHIDRNHSDDLSCLLKKVPRPINFGFMGVILDNINWNNNFDSKPCFDPNTTVLDHRYTYYYSNSIRFVKEFDYGNKLNLIYILLERNVDFEKLAPCPQKFEDFCARLGKPMYKKTICVFDDDENAKLKTANEAIEQSINKNEYYDLFIEFKRDYPHNSQGIAQEVMDSLTPIQGLSPKKIFTNIAKKHGFRYRKCVNGQYELEKFNLYNHKIKVLFLTQPFSSLFFAEICVCGYNFNFHVADLPEVIVDNDSQVELYAKKVFEVADQIEKKFTEKLFLSYGKTPDWYENYPD